jgi:hypothetical protein
VIDSVVWCVIVCRQAMYGMEDVCVVCILERFAIRDSAVILVSPKVAETRLDWLQAEQSLLGDDVSEY